MGHGGARELETGSDPLPELDPELAERLEVAMKKMDVLDAQFKSARDDERLAQSSKMWNLVTKEIDGHLRMIAKALNQSHQVSLDTGSDGGGLAIKPWIEDTACRFEKMYIRMTEEREIIASIGTRDFARGRLEDISYDWVMKLVVEWLVQSVARKG